MRPLVTATFLLLVASYPRAFNTDARFSTTTGNISDLVTGLLWKHPDSGLPARDAGVVGYSYTDAQGLCTTPWRLPAVDELVTLLDVRAGGAPYLDAAFAATSSVYWSTTPVAGNPAHVWTFDTQAAATAITSTTSFGVAICVQ